MNRAIYCTMILMSSCASLSQGSSSNNVSMIVERRLSVDGQIVAIHGLLKEDGGYYNIYSRDGERCVGLLLTDLQRSEYRVHANSEVLVRGVLEAEGCGREGVCVERLCGPAILTGVALEHAR